MVSEFNSCIGEEKIDIKDVKKLTLKDDRSGTMATGVDDYYKMACMYYEYMQFKRSEFKCTNLEYDEGNTGRVKKIEFQFDRIR